MFCRKCGKPMADNAAFCTACGAQAISPEPATKEGWMFLAVKDSILNQLRLPMQAQFGSFHNVTQDDFGRTYAEIKVYAPNALHITVPILYAVGFYDVTDGAPCTVIPGSLRVLPRIVLPAERSAAKKKMHFGMHRQHSV